MKKLLISSAVIVFMALVWLGYEKGLFKQSGSVVNLSENPVATSSLEAEIIATSSARALIKEEQSSFPKPSLERSTQPRIPLSSFAKDDAVKNIGGLVSILKKNPEDYSAWVSLGIYRKTLGDYEGAEEVWKYVTVQWPTDFVAYNNLGNLYHEQLRDFPKAETYFRKTADLKPDFVQSYVNLYNLYRYSYKEKEKEAPEALALGLKRNPAEVNLMIVLARYYAEMKDLVQAASYYAQAVSAAEKDNKSELVANLKKEALEAGVTLSL